MVRINGQDKGIAGMRLTDYLEREGYNLSRIAIEYNGDILPKSRYGEVCLADGDKIEIVAFVGGG